MTQLRARIVFFVLCAALLAVFFSAAVPAFSFVSLAADLSGSQLGRIEDADDLGLGIGPISSGDEALFTLFYNATTYGEMQPCPT